MGIRELIMERFLVSLRKKLAVSEFLMEKLKTNLEFSHACAKVFGQLSHIDYQIKEIFLQRAI